MHFSLKILFLTLFVMLGSCQNKKGHSYLDNNFKIGIDTGDYDLHSNIYRDTSGSSGIVGMLLYSTLFEQNEGQVLSADLVQSFSVNNNKTIWNIKINSPVYFHDGILLTANHIKEAYVYVKKDAASPFCFLLNSIESIEVLNDNELVFRLSRPDVFFIYALKIIPIAKYDANKNVFIGAGPYKIEAYSENTKVLRLKAQQPYYKPGPYIKQVTLHFLPNYLEGLALLTQNKLDFLYLADPTYEKLFENNKEFEVVYQKKPLSYVVEFNKSSGRYFEQANHRYQASQLLSGDNSMGSIVWDHANPDTLSVISYAEHERNRSALYQMLQVFYAQGIKLKTSLYPLSDFLHALSKKEYDMALYPANFSFEDLYLYQYLKDHPEQISQIEMIETIRYGETETLREEALKKVLKEFHDNPSYSVLFKRDLPIVINKRFKGYSKNPSEILYEVQKMWVDNSL